jgi:hypothetical protein
MWNSVSYQMETFGSCSEDGKLQKEEKRKPFDSTEFSLCPGVTHQPSHEHGCLPEL